MQPSLAQPSLSLELPTHMEGWWLLEAVKVDSEGREISRRVAADWFPNMILDGGLDAMGTVAYGVGCVVGSGNTTPAAGQTLLTTFVAGATNPPTNASGAQGTTAPYYGWFRKTWRFNAGTAAGNLAEIGVTIANSSPGATEPLYSRALITDGAGTPTTITILSDEILDATYELRQYQNQTDVVTTENINGVSTTVTIRAASASSQYGLFAQPQIDSSSALYSGNALGTVLTIPTTGYIANIAQGVVGGLVGSYIGSSYYRDFYLQYGVGYAGNIGALYFVTSRGIYQVSLNPVVTLLNTQTFNLRLRMSWARYP